jgi:hypothetical protein
MRFLIVELQTFKDDNEKIKKEHEDQQERNEILLQNIVEKIKLKKTELNKGNNKLYFEISSR